MKRPKQAPVLVFTRPLTLISPSSLDSPYFSKSRWGLSTTMNSYPPDLLAQLSPVMFVAGLGLVQSPSTPQSPPPRPQDPFTLLGHRLKDALLSQRTPAIWQPDKSKTFQVVLVDPVSRRDSPSAMGHHGCRMGFTFGCQSQCLLTMLTVPYYRTYAFHRAKCPLLKINSSCRPGLLSLLLRRPLHSTLMESLRLYGCESI
jgi:hypothetical protein